MEGDTKWGIRLILLACRYTYCAFPVDSITWINNDFQHYFHNFTWSFQKDALSSTFFPQKTPKTFTPKRKSALGDFDGIHRDISQWVNRVFVLRTEMYLFNFCVLYWSGFALIRTVLNVYVYSVVCMLLMFLSVLCIIAQPLTSLVYSFLYARIN